MKKIKKKEEMKEINEKNENRGERKGHGCGKEKKNGEKGKK